MKEGLALVDRLRLSHFKTPLSGGTGRSNERWVWGVPRHIEQLEHEVNQAGGGMWQRTYSPRRMISFN